MTRLYAAALLLTSGLMNSPAFAITAGDVMNKMEQKERFGYITGLVDMLSYTAILTGNRPRAECISKAFYGKKDEAWGDVVELFGRYPDKSPEGLVVVLMNQACGS